MEYNIPLIILINKVDKVSNIDKRKSINLFIDSAKEYSLNLIHLDNFKSESKANIPYLDTSALKKINIVKLKQFIQVCLKK